MIIYRVGNKKNNNKVPLFLSRIKAGFPTPAEDFIEKELNLHDLLVTKPLSTFFLKVSGDSMIGAHILHNDIIVVDRSKEAKHKDIVVAAINGELTIKRLIYKESSVQLMPENSNYKTITINTGEELHIWGVVTSVVHIL